MIISISNNKTIKEVVKDRFQSVNLSENDIIDLTIELSIELNIELNKKNLLTS